MKSRILLILLLVFTNLTTLNAMDEPPVGKIINITGGALGLPIAGNENVYLSTFGLISCTCLVMTDGENTLLAHVLSTEEKNFHTIVSNCIAEMKNRYKGSKPQEIKVRAYYFDTRAQAQEIRDIAHELGVKDVSAPRSFDSDPLFNIRGNKLDHKLVGAQNYYYSDGSGKCDEWSKGGVVVEENKDLVPTRKNDSKHQVPSPTPHCGGKHKINMEDVGLVNPWYVQIVTYKSEHPSSKSATKSSSSEGN